MGFKELSKHNYLLLSLISLVFLLSLSIVPAQSSCTNDLQCGFTGFFGSEFCKTNDVYKNYQTAGCNSNICSVLVEEKLVNDCDDVDNSTLDTCINGNNLAYCKHDLVQCVENDECGSPTEHFFCQNGDVWHQVNNPVCNVNASQCIFDSSEELYEQCQYGCNNAACISQILCSSNADCPSSTISENFCFSDDVIRENVSYNCVYPGTPASYCQQTTQQELVQTCSNSCYNGKCISDNNDKKTSRGGIQDFNDLDPLFFEKKQEPQSIGMIIPASETNESVSKVTKTSSFNLWLLFWLFLLLVLILLLLLIIVAFRRR